MVKEDVFRNVLKIILEKELVELVKIRNNVTLLECLFGINYVLRIVQYQLNLTNLTIILAFVYQNVPILFKVIKVKENV